MKLISSLALLFTFLALAQTPTASSDQLHVNYAFKGDGSFSSGTNLILDSPLFLSKDSSGKVHLGLGSRIPGSQSISPLQLSIDSIQESPTLETCSSFSANRLLIDSSGLLSICMINTDGTFRLIQLQGH